MVSVCKLNIGTTYLFECGPASLNKGWWEKVRGGGSVDPEGVIAQKDCPLICLWQKMAAKAQVSMQALIYLPIALAISGT